MTPPVGWVRITSQDPPVNVLARLSDERVNPSSGYGGWEEVERPRKKPLTSWKSQPGVRLELPILLDGYLDDVSVEDDIAAIEKLGRPSAADGEPPQLTIVATGGMVPHQTLTWVVEDLSFGDGLADSNGNRVRQQITLGLLQYVEDVYLAERSAANRRRKKRAALKRKRGAARKRVVAHRSSRKKKAGGAHARSVAAPAFGEGEDLLALAARELGDADRWVEIAELNGIRDPRNVEPGQVLRLP